MQIEQNKQRNRFVSIIVSTRRLSRIHIFKECIQKTYFSFSTFVDTRYISPFLIQSSSPGTILFHKWLLISSRLHLESPLSRFPDFTIVRFGTLCIAIALFCPQVTAHIPARPLSVNSWLQQEEQQWWSFLALNPGVHAHYLAAWVFANPHSSASPAHTATTTTKPLHQLRREHLVWMICLNRRQEVRSVLNHRYCFPKKKIETKQRQKLVGLPLHSCWVSVATYQCC